MKIKKSSGTSILRFEEEAGDSRQLFEIDSKYTEISHDASEDVKNGGAKYLTIPPSVKLIGDKAFANWYFLETIFNASGVVIYGKQCFCNCFRLDLFDSGNETKSIWDEAFYGCQSLKTVYLRKNVAYVGKRAFAKISPSAIIYCEHQSQPASFDKEWTDVPSKNIIWGYKTKAKQSTSLNNKVKTKETKATTKISSSSTSNTTSNTSVRKDTTTTTKATSSVTLKYCYPCKKSFPREYQYCPICRAELISETEYKAKLEEDRLKVEQEKSDKRENDILVNNSKKLYEFLNKYESIDIYTIITEVFHIYNCSLYNSYLRHAFKQCYSGKNYYFDSNYNREELFKLYDVLIEHKSFKCSDAISAVNKGVNDIKEKLNKLNSLLKECTYIKNNESLNYGKLTSGWLNGGYFEITSGSSQRIEEKNSGEKDYFGETIYSVRKYISYYIDKYYAQRSISSRISNELRITSSDYGIKYILMMYEILLLQKYLYSEIHYISDYLETRKRATVKYPQLLNINQLVDFLVKNKVISKCGSRTSKDSIYVR